MDPHAHDLELRDRLSVDVLGREYPDATDWDGNWLMVSVTAKDNVSQVAIEGPCMLTTDFKLLLNGASGLLSGKLAEFQMQTIEPMMEISIQKYDALGHFEVRLVLRTDESLSHGPDFCHSMHQYTFGIDQTDLHKLQRQAERVLTAYPVIG